MAGATKKDGFWSSSPAVPGIIPGKMILPFLSETGPIKIFLIWSHSVVSLHTYHYVPNRVGLDDQIHFSQEEE